MKIKLIQTKDYLLLIDEEAEIKEGKTFITKDNIIHSNYGYNYGDRVVIAYYPLTKEAKELDLPLLPNPFKEVDVEKLACKKYDIKEGINDYDERYYNSHNVAKAEAFIAGYKAAQPKQFSLEDMKKAIEMAREMKDDEGIFDVHSIRGLTEVCTYDWEERYSEKEIIQSLSTQQLPKEFVPEYRYYYHSSKEFYSDAGFVECSKEQYESIKVEIPTCPLKAEIKTITNSGGKEEIVGTYIN